MQVIIVKLFCRAITIGILSVGLISFSSALVFAKSFHDLSHIVFEISAARGGRGDVAASYLSILELIKIKKFPNQISVVVGHPEKKILQGLMQGSPDGKLFQSRVQIHELGSIPETLNPADMVIRFAEADGRVRNPKRFYSSGPHSPEHIRIKPDGLIVSQPVIGNTEGGVPHGTIRLRGRDFRMEHPGLRGSHGGTYLDPVALEFRNMDRMKIAQEILSDVRGHADSGTAEAITNLLERRSLANARLGLVYGISNTDTSPQFVKYLNGFQGAQSPVVLVTPSRVNIDEIKANPDLKVKVQYVKAGAPLPAQGQAKTIYIVETKGLSHRTFTGLMAISQPTPLVAGDGAMSAAITLERPFAITSVGHNKDNLEAYRNRLLHETKDKNARARILKLLNPNDPALDLAQHLGPPEAKAFQAVAQKTPSVLSSVINATNYVLDNNSSAPHANGRPLDSRLAEDVKQFRAASDASLVDTDPALQKDLLILRKCLLRGYCLQHEVAAANRSIEFPQAAQILEEARAKISGNGEKALTKVTKVLSQLGGPHSADAIQTYRVANFRAIAGGPTGLLDRWIKNELPSLGPKDPSTIEIYKELLKQPLSHEQIEALSSRVHRFKPSMRKEFFDIARKHGHFRSMAAVSGASVHSVSEMPAFIKSITDSAEFLEDVKSGRGRWWFDLIDNTAARTGQPLEMDSARASQLVKLASNSPDPQLLWQVADRGWFRNVEPEVQYQAIAQQNVKDRIKTLNKMGLPPDQADRLFGYIRRIEFNKKNHWQAFRDAYLAGKALGVSPSEIADLGNSFKKLRGSSEAFSAAVTEMVDAHVAEVERSLAEKLKQAQICY